MSTPNQPPSGSTGTTNTQVSGPPIKPVIPTDSRESNPRGSENVVNDRLADVLEKLFEASNKAPALPKMSIFEAPKEGHFMIDAQGRKVAHRNGEPVYLNDDGSEIEE